MDGKCLARAETYICPSLALLISARVPSSDDGSYRSSSCSSTSCLLLLPLWLHLLAYSDSEGEFPPVQGATLVRLCL